MSDDLKLSAVQMEAIKDMGFCDYSYDSCDQSDDGMISLKDQSSSFILLDGYQKAFNHLAALDGETAAIDAQDFAKLAQLEVLAEVMAGDPAYAVVVERQTGLEFGEKELKPNPDTLKPGVPRRHFRRMVYYAQMALGQIVDNTIEEDGDYGEHTRQIISQYQKAVGISPDDGTLLGPQTIGTLIMKCRYDKSKLIKILEDDIDVAPKDGFIINDAFTVTEKKIREDVIVALKWLGYLPESVESSDKTAIKNALTAHFDNAIRVGPIVLGRILDRVSKSPF